jgi:hypothetical protein
VAPPPALALALVTGESIVRKAAKIAVNVINCFFIMMFPIGRCQAYTSSQRGGHSGAVVETEIG